jgi:anti-sigma regulatory factor (Ser/Thr protein kinase)
VVASNGQGRSLDGDFAGADDLLWAAQSGGLPGLGEVSVERSGQIGPLVEMLMARRADPVPFTHVRFAAPFALVIEQAIAVGTIAGSAFAARHGVFPLARFAETGDGADHWALWRSRAEQAAIAVSFPRPFAAAIIGAMGELQENVLRHSHRPETGLVAYAATASAFEIVVADAGVGVLASLRECSEHAGVLDAGEALKVAVEDGQSRFGRASGGGFGMGQMFRALANHDGELRFRSDDHALAVRGHSPSLQGSVELGQKARLAGLTISVRCQAPNGTSRDP